MINTYWVLFFEESLRWQSIEAQSSEATGKFPFKTQSTAFIVQLKAGRVRCVWIILSNAKSFKMILNNQLNGIEWGAHLKAFNEISFKLIPEIDSQKQCRPHFFHSPLLQYACQTFAWWFKTKLIPLLFSLFLIIKPVLCFYICFHFCLLSLSLLFNSSLTLIKIWSCLLN